MTLIFTPSSPDDGPRVIEIWRLAVDATHDFLTPADRQAIDGEVCAFLPEAPLLLAQTQSGETLGFMFVHDGHMEALFIDPACHGQGVGRALVEQALSQVPDLTTDVNEQNPGALGFYKRMGFVPTGRSERDDQGRAYPLIHLAYSRTQV